MASKTKTVSGNVNTYIITDFQGNTVTVALTQNVAGNTTTFTSSGNVHHDGQRMLMELLQLLGTGQIP